MGLLLGVNIDHAATLRQARYARMPGCQHEEPSLERFAALAEDAGADSITIHLREDRRHIQDRDVQTLRSTLRVPMNLEMGNAPEIVEIAVAVRPHFACLVPENRAEITTEGGLDARANFQALQRTIARLQAVGTRVSLFVDPQPDQIQAAAELNAEMVELHTGTFANETGKARADEVKRLAQAAQQAFALGLQVNAGHGITTENLRELFALPHLTELNVGHHLLSESLFLGLGEVLRRFRAVMAEYPSQY
jgi:pyridoxine 5-phosphate synthase